MPWRVLERMNFHERVFYDKFAFRWACAVDGKGRACDNKQCEINRIFHSHRDWRKWKIRETCESWSSGGNLKQALLRFHFKISSWIMRRVSKSQNSTIRPFIVPLKSQRSFVHTRPTRAESSSNEVFYTLAASEESLIQFDKGAMKQVASIDKIQLKSDMTGYLQTRYSERPPRKYNFPEATSMRYGWISWEVFIVLDKRNYENK